MAIASLKLTSRILFLPSSPHFRKVPLLLPFRRPTTYPVNPLPLISSLISLRKIMCNATEVPVTKDKGSKGGVSDKEGKNWVPVVPMAALPKGERRVIIQNGETIWLLQYKDDIFVIENRSPTESAYFEGLLNAKLTMEAINLRGVRPQVEQLQAQLNRMQCFLEAADARPKGGADEIIIHDCVAEIREASYDAEAAIATFVVKIAFLTSGRSDQFPFVLKRYLCIFKECLALREVRLEIEVINTRVTNSLTTGFQICGILNSTGVGESSSTIKAILYPYCEEDVVGTEEDVKAVVDLLVKEKTQYRVVSIWGMGDLGKTTLAKMVYKNIEIMRHFKCVAWAYISEQYNTREVLEGILIKLLSLSNKERKAIGKLKHDELVKKLHQVQSEKKCLVILDDIWKDVDWDSLSPSFPNTTEVGSKILLTTHNENVAKHVDQQRVLYKLRHLIEKESWELLCEENISEKKRRYR
ncbi:putative disease resistance protein [Camellia lanceoleosa]|uniref:Disease resistance protein n=1 Tax=Camellia lanceoleosa TaxID=1840588 RepID=A0ACC0IJC1_9ERIC|nr:putative disease resistance protein [Camellia lanceoleosa]